MQALTINEVNQVSGGISRNDVIGGLVGVMAGADLAAVGAESGLLFGGPIGAGIGFVLGAGLTYALDRCSRRSPN